MSDINTLRRVLRESRTLAIVGLSADWFRPSNFAAKYMQAHGYRIIPVNHRSTRNTRRFSAGSPPPLE